MQWRKFRSRRSFRTRCSFIRTSPFCGFSVNYVRVVCFCHLIMSNGCGLRIAKIMLRKRNFMDLILDRILLPLTCWENLSAASALVGNSASEKKILSLQFQKGSQLRSALLVRLPFKTAG